MLRACAIRTTAAGTWSSSPARVANALARSEQAQAAIEDEVLQALDAEERDTLRQLLARALRSMEPLEEDAPYSATIASIST